MSESKFKFCYNPLEQRFFEVSAVHTVNDPYRKNYYRFCLRLSFYEDDVDLNRIDDMRQLCLRKITNLMTEQKLWKNHHSFYVVQYEIRTMARKSNDLNQQNDNEGTSDDDSASSVNTHETSSTDSAYGSPDSDLDSTMPGDSADDSIHYWGENDESDDFAEGLRSSDSD